MDNRKLSLLDLIGEWRKRTAANGWDEDAAVAYDVAAHELQRSLAQQAQPEMPTREMIAKAIRFSDQSDSTSQTAFESYLVNADAVLALFAPKETPEGKCSDDHPGHPHHWALNDGEIICAYSKSQ